MGTDSFLQFDFTALDDHQFKEDSVREELIAPLLKRLGYSATGLDRIVRSPVLEHPYVAIGTTKHKISIIPDYLLYVDGRPAWILDAKSPRQKVDNPDHVSQGYSYAIHRDIRVDLFAVCNGHELAIFSVADMRSAPRARFRLSDIDTHWSDLARLVGPAALRDARSREPFAKDFGILLMKLGVKSEITLSFPSVPVFHIARINQDLYSMSGNVQFEDSKYMATFDFSSQLFAKLLKMMPEQIAKKVRLTLSNPPPVILNFSKPPVSVNIETSLGNQIEENNREHWVPLQARDFK